MPWGRVGSNLLMNLIGQAKIKKKLNSEKLNQLKTAEEQVVWMREFYEFDQIPDVRLIGSKQNVLSMRDIAVIANLARAERLHLIRMRRDNFVKAAVSQMRAEEYAQRTLHDTGTARWAVRPEDPRPESGRIDPSILLRRVRMMHDQQLRMLNWFGSLEGIDIEYDELRCNLHEIYTRVAGYLGLPSALPSVQFIKATPDNLQAAVTNYAEILSVLAGTEYEGLV